MTELKRALQTFWKRFGVPAYLDDCVPDGTEPPYITYTVSRANLRGSTVLTAFNWHRREPDGNIARTHMMDRIAKAIPTGGVFLHLENGYLDIRRNDAGFQTDWQDPNDPDVIGGRTSYEVIFYTAK